MTTTAEHQAVSVVVPAFQEAASIGAALTRLARVMDSCGRPYEIVVVSDGSTDTTALRARELRLPHTTVHEYAPNRGDVPGRGNGVLISMANGKANEYSMNTVQERGTLFVKHNDEIYEGMIVGENARAEDMDVNPTKEKKLTNVRSSTAEVLVRLVPHRQLSLDQALEFLREDEAVEVTPAAVRLRKAALDKTERTKAARRARAAAAPV